jgi:hypothetical protein
MFKYVDGVLYKIVLTYSFTLKVLVIDHSETSLILLGATFQTAGIIRRIIIYV